MQTTNHFESTTLTKVKTPWWWQLWIVETCRRRFCMSVMYIFHCTYSCFSKIFWFTKVQVFFKTWWYTETYL